LPRSRLRIRVRPENVWLVISVMTLLYKDRLVKLTSALKRLSIRVKKFWPRPSDLRGQKTEAASEQQESKGRKRKQRRRNREEELM
jgi:hypothetical protein